MLAVLILADPSGFCAVTVLAAVLHECGHLLAAKCLRVPLGSLRMDFLGARLEVSGRLLSYGEEWLLSAAGPFASLLVAALAAPLWGLLPLSRLFSCASLLLGLLNLLPVSTFDGGRMMETTLLRFLPENSARCVMRFSSFLFLFLLWAIAVYFLIRAAGGISLLCFSMSLFAHFFEAAEER
jgi:Zn-dependent protease